MTISAQCAYNFNLLIEMNEIQYTITGPLICSNSSIVTFIEYYYGYCLMI